MTTQPDNGSPGDACVICGMPIDACNCPAFRPLSKPEPEGGEPECPHSVPNAAKSIIQDGAQQVGCPAAQESNPPEAAKEVAKPTGKRFGGVIEMLISLHGEEVSALTRELEEAKAEVVAQYKKTEYAKEVRRNMAKMYEDSIRKRDQEHEQTKAELAEAKDRYKNEYDTVDRIWRALGITTYEGADGKEISEIVAEKVSALAATRKELEEAKARLVNRTHTMKLDAEREFASLRARLAEVERERDAQLYPENLTGPMPYDTWRAIVQVRDETFRELEAVRKASESESSEHKRSKAWITELEKYRDKLIAERNAALAAKDEADKLRDDEAVAIQSIISDRDTYKRQAEEAEEKLERAEEGLRGVCLEIGFDPSDGEGTSPEEVVAYVKTALSDALRSAAESAALAEKRGEALRKGGSR